jgi:trans-aconitate methyltransferase
MDDVWAQGEAYERFMGRWSRLVAPLFLDWLDAPGGQRWADVGCGSGALTAAILQQSSPASVLALDPSDAQVDEAARRIQDPRVSFGVGTAGNLPARSFDAVVSGLVLNFVPDPVAAVSAMRRAAPGGAVAAYVWDYADGMRLLRIFWDVACSLDPAAADLHEGHRFQLASTEVLVRVWTDSGIGDVAVTSLTVPTVFEDFDDFWSPFLGGQGPAATYVASLDEPARENLRAALERELPEDADGRIRLTARAWAVRGTSSELSP